MDTAMQDQVTFADLIRELEDLHRSGDEESWQERALCAQTDPEVFFPERGEPTTEAKRICRMCEVQAECLEYALDRRERFGVWGGTSERERRAVIARREAESAA